jgi:hypothetical protein
MSRSSLVLAALLGATLAIPAGARAQEACQAFDFRSGTTCEVLVSGGCTTQCEPIRFVGACDARCEASASVDCTASCSASCAAECTVDPGSFDCQASCTADCGASCMASCTDADCEAQCMGSCDARCEASCEAVAPTADCTARCEASCEGSCTVEANLDCTGTCAAELSGGCTTQCEQPDGALFCDGQYVAASDVEECIDQLLALGFDVDASATGSCSGGTCMASASASCAASPGRTNGAGLTVLGFLAIALVASRRRG